MCITKEEYIKLRYLLVFDSSSTHNVNITTDKLELHKHYYNYIGKLRTKSEVELQERIMKKMEIQNKEDPAVNLAILKSKEEVKASYPKKVDGVLESFEGDIKKTDLTKVFVSKATGQEHKELLADYTNLIISDNIKATSVSIKDNNCFIWRVIINAEKHEVHKDLKADFMVIKPIRDNVIFR